MRDHRHKNLWLTLMATGLRFGEAAGLQWDAVDLESGTVVVRLALSRTRGGKWDLDEPKTAKSRRVLPLPEYAIEALRDQQARVEEMHRADGNRWQPNKLVFPSTVGTPLREAHVLAAFHRVLARAGIPRHSMHDLRDTYATNLAVLGTHPRVAQEMLGHTRIDTTMRIYTAVVPEAMRDAANRLDTLMPIPVKPASGAIPEA